MSYLKTNEKVDGSIPLYLQVLDVLAFFCLFDFCFGFEVEKLREIEVISSLLKSLGAFHNAL